MNAGRIDVSQVLLIVVVVVVVMRFRLVSSTRVGALILCPSPTPFSDADM